MNTERNSSASSRKSEGDYPKISLQDCATQITTLPPVEPTEDISADENFVAPADEVVLMPVSSGFNDYPFYYPNRINEPDDTQVKSPHQQTIHWYRFLKQSMEKKAKENSILFFFPLFVATKSTLNQTEKKKK